MESIQEKLLHEIARTPDRLLPEVLDFVIFLNSRYLQMQPRKPKGWQPGFFEEVSPLRSWGLPK